MRDEGAVRLGACEPMPADKGAPGPARASIPVPPWERRSTLYVWGYGPPWAVVVRTRITLWGYGRPQSIVVQNQVEETEAARLWAGARGWDAARPGAWAGEITTPLTAVAADRTLAPTLRLDPAVAGWACQDLDELSQQGR